MWLQPFEERERLFQFGKELFLRLELARMHTAAQAPHLHRVPEVEHLVVEQVFDGVAGAGWAVEDAAHDDRVVGGVVMARLQADRKG